MGTSIGETIAAELLERLDRGEPPDLAEFLARYPGHGDLVRGAFAAAALVAEAGAGPPSNPVGAANPRDLAPGTRLGDFEIEGLRGRGGMGVVYRARQRSLGDRLVALKVLQADAATAPERARFQREALHLAELHHPNLATVYGFGEQGGLLFYAMRLVEGPTLRERIAGRRAQGGRSLAGADLRRAVALAADVAAALAEVHARGLLHRDVKPSNVIVERDAAADGRERAVLVDFGLVRKVGGDPLTAGGPTPATPSYAAPEQVLGQPVTARADVFSLGVTLHDLVCGRLPDDRAPATAGLEPLAALVPGIDADLGAIVAKAVDPLARWRYPHAGALLADLHAWQSGRDVSARRPPLGERLARFFARRWPGLLQTLGIALAAVLGIGALWQEAEFAALEHRARAAHERNDWRVLVALPELASDRARWFGVSEELRSLVGTLTGADLDERLLDVLREQTRGETAAREFVARELARATPAGLPQFADYLAREVRARPEEALGVVARYFVEEPVLDLADERATLPLRRALYRVVDDGQRTEAARLLAIAALSGCADAHELPRWLERARAAPAASEEQRLAILAAERTVRRYHAAGRAAELPLGAIDADCESLWRRSLALRRQRGDAAAYWRMQDASGALLAAVAFAARTLGQVPAFVTAAAGERYLPPLVFDPLGSSAAEILAAAGDPRAFDGLPLWFPTEPDPRALRWLGMQIAAHGGVAPPVELLQTAAVASGLAEGAAARGGILLAHEVDRSTRMDHAAAATAPAALFVEDRRPDVRSDGDPWVSVRREELNCDAARACALMEDGSLELDEAGYPFLRLAPFGRSYVAISFRHWLPPLRGGYYLLFRHDSAQRRYLPHFGQVQLAVWLDDEVLGPLAPLSGAISNGSWDHCLPLPSAAFDGHWHTLTIRVEPNSTTTYRCYGLDLSDRDIRGPRPR